MTDSEAERIRAQIDATRADLSDNVNELEAKVSPSQIAQRQKDRVRSGVTAVKDKVMGVAEDASDKVGSAVSDSPGALARQTRGNPLAAGLIAFGVGALLSSLLPASKPEAKAAAAVKEQAQPLVDELSEGAKEIAGNLQEPAQLAAESVKAAATDAVDTVKQEATSETENVTDAAKEAKGTMQQHASSGS